jgi:hypothetical protein
LPHWQQLAQNKQTRQAGGECVLAETARQRNSTLPPTPSPCRSQFQSDKSIPSCHPAAMKNHNSLNA